jgi:Na+/proline symporter
MSFESLIDKVHQAETALEASERRTGANWRQFKSSWADAWTPGRIVSIGLVTGFLVGKAEPAKRVVRGSGALQMVSALAGLFAGGSAQAAAGHAQEAADTAQQTAAAVSPEAALAQQAASPVQPMHTPDDLRAAGML